MERKPEFPNIDTPRLIRKTSISQAVRMLPRLDPEKQAEILASIERDDPQAAAEIRDRLAKK